MTRKKLNAFCAALPHVTHVIQWGEHDVYKIGGKVFAILGEIVGENGSVPTVTFKVSVIAYEMLKEEQGCRPAPYLASRGMTWIQAYDEPGLSDDDLKAYIRQSYALVGAGLPKKTRLALGLPA